MVNKDEYIYIYNVIQIYITTDVQPLQMQYGTTTVLTSVYMYHKVSLYGDRLTTDINCPNSMRINNF